VGCEYFFVLVFVWLVRAIIIIIMVSSRLTVDVEQASFNNFFLPGTWQALIICGQHIQEYTHAVPGTETDSCTTGCVWNAHMTLELQQNEGVKHLEIQLLRNREYVCTALVPLQENTGESKWYKLETSPGESCGHVKLMFTWALQGPQVCNILCGKPSTLL
jgi:hypothetical protein